MFGVSSDGKIIPVNRDFSIRIPYGAGYDVYEAKGDALDVLTITRFEELPTDYTDGMFQPRSNDGKSDVITFSLTHALSQDSLRQMNFTDFLGQIKRSTDEQLAKAAVGSVAAQTEGENYSVLKAVQNTPEIKAGYITSDLFVAANFMAFIITKNHVYRGTLKITRQAQKFKRTELFMRSLLSSVKPNAN